MKYLATLLLLASFSCTLTKNNNKVDDVKLEALTDSCCRDICIFYFKRRLI